MPGPTSNEMNLKLLSSLIENWEDETIEFKEASSDFDTDKIGRYVSALGNAANLADKKSAWLVFGVRNKTHSVVGTDYRSDPKRLDSLKRQINDDSEPHIAFRSIREVSHPDGRVVIFEIPSAPLGMPIAWKGHWYDRVGENLTPLSVEKLDTIRGQDRLLDWSARIVEDACIDDLSPEAMVVARRAFSERNSTRISQTTVDGWTDEEFLLHTGLMTRRGLTRASILLLGKPESAYLLSPLLPELTWKLVGQESAYEHFTIPFLLATTQLYNRIRNIKVRLLPPDELIQREVEKYDQATVLEAIHNCIAHQDYSRHSRVSVTEYPDRLEFVSVGSFFEGSPDEYALNGRIPRQYRNTALVNAMTNLNMIDHLGYGIERMNRSQRDRYLPLPDYDLSVPGEVRLVIYGSVVDEAYTKLLMKQSDLPFEDVLALDRVQKGRPIPEQMIRRLRRKGLVEGRQPHLRVAASVAVATGTQADYIKQRGESDEYCSALVTDYLKRNGKASRQEIDAVVFPSLSVELSDAQKKVKVKNLLSKLARHGTIRFEKGERSGWMLG